MKVPPTSTATYEPDNVCDIIWIFISCIGNVVATAVHLTDAWIGFLVGWAWSLLCILLGLLLASLKWRRAYFHTLEVFFFVLYAICWGLVFVRPAYGVPSNREVQIVQYYPFFSTGGLAMFSALTAVTKHPWTAAYIQGLVPLQSIHHPLVLETAFINIWIWTASSVAACLLYLIPFTMKVELQVPGKYSSSTTSNPLAVIFGIVVPICAVILPAMFLYFWPPRVDPKQYMTGQTDPKAEASGDTMSQSLVLALPPAKPGWMGGEKVLEEKTSDFPPPILPMPNAKSEGSNLYPPVPPSNWAVQPSAPVHYFADSQNLSQSGLIPSAPVPTSSTFRYNTGSTGETNASYVNQLYQQQPPPPLNSNGAIPSTSDGAYHQHNAWLGNILMGGGGPQAGGIPQGPVRVGDYSYLGGTIGVPASPSSPLTIHHMHHVFVYNDHGRQPPEGAQDIIPRRTTRTVVE